MLGPGSEIRDAGRKKNEIRDAGQTSRIRNTEKNQQREILITVRNGMVRTLVLRPPLFTGRRVGSVLRI
jgi:hypothetical protein